MKFKSFLPIVLLIIVTSLFSSCKEKKEESKGHAHAETTTEYQCPMDCEDGKIYKNPGQCPVCKMDIALLNSDSKSTCSVHEDGNCECEGDRCACANCEEHSKTMTCTVHKDGKCKCEGDKCACANCEEHS